MPFVRSRSSLGSRCSTSTLSPREAGRALGVKTCPLGHTAWVRQPEKSPPRRRVPLRRPQSMHRLLSGAPPKGTRKFSLSYTWASSFHPSPSGRKLKELSDALHRLGASGRDVVFVDYLSLPQSAREAMPAEYFSANELPKAPMMDRTFAERRQFGFALSEMTRLYVFRECKVIVLPRCESPSQFPGTTGEPLLRNGDRLEIAGGEVYYQVIRAPAAAHALYLSSHANHARAQTRPSYVCMWPGESRPSNALWICHVEGRSSQWQCHLHSHGLV